MSKVTVTALQIPVIDNVNANAKTLKRNILANKTSDWIVTPECSLSGYYQPPVLNDMDAQAQQRYEKKLEEVEGEQQNQHVGLILGTGHVEGDGMPYNQARVYNRNGDLLSTYSKRLLCRGASGGGETKYYLPGYTPNYFYVDADQTHIGSTLICNDAWATPKVSPGGNPYYGWELARQGVKVIFVLANCNVTEWDPLVYAYHDTHLRQMARDNNVWVVVSNSSLAMSDSTQLRTGPEQDFKRKAIDRVQVSSGIIAPNGDWAAWCDDTGEDSVTLTLDLERGTYEVPGAV